jgi:hypothetical protein
MYYDASSSDYISTPSFAIPNTGILTVEAWMKSAFNTTIEQSIIGEPMSSSVGFIFFMRAGGSNQLRYYHSSGSGSFQNPIIDYFLNLDNQ